MPSTSCFAELRTWMPGTSLGMTSSCSTNEACVKRFADLSEQEILALAITNEEEDSRIYRGFAEGLREKYAASAKVFDEMAEEEVRHRSMLFDLYRSKFVEYLPRIRRQDVKGFIHKKPLWLLRPVNLDEVRKFAENMEYEAARFYRRAPDSTPGTSARQLLRELPDAEVEHQSLPHKPGQHLLTPTAPANTPQTPPRPLSPRTYPPPL